MTQPAPKATFADLQAFRRHLSTSGVNTLEIKQLAKNAFCLGSAGERSSERLFLSEVGVSAPLLFETMEQSARFAIKTFHIRRIDLDLINDELI